MRFAAIILLCILAAITYGILHNQVTARICLEYFTIGHPLIFPRAVTGNPTLLAIGWGIVASWWVGLLLGIPLACAARRGSRPKLTAPDLLRPIALLLLTMAVIATLAGAVGHFAAARHWVWLLQPLASRVPADRHIAFLTALWAHSASYLAGFLGGLLLCIWTYRRRRAAGGAVTPHSADELL